MKAEPMRYHGPGWNVTAPNGDLFQVWAPQTEADAANSLNPPRDHWAASWSENVPEDADEDYMGNGFYINGPTLASVLAVGFINHPDLALARSAIKALTTAIQKAATS